MSIRLFLHRRAEKEKAKKVTQKICRIDIKRKGGIAPQKKINFSAIFTFLNSCSPDNSIFTGWKNSIFILAIESDFFVETRKIEENGAFF